jgi:hypothetical protein
MCVGIPLRSVARLIFNILLIPQPRADHLRRRLSRRARIPGMHGVTGSASSAVHAAANEARADPVRQLQGHGAKAAFTGPIPLFAQPATAPEAGGETIRALAKPTSRPSPVPSPPCRKLSCGRATSTVNAEGQ